MISIGVDHIILRSKDSNYMCTIQYIVKFMYGPCILFLVMLQNLLPVISKYYTVIQNFIFNFIEFVGMIPNKEPCSYYISCIYSKSSQAGCAQIVDNFNMTYFKKIAGDSSVQHHLASQGFASKTFIVVVISII
jgi:hypothetical protein